MSNFGLSALGDRALLVRLGDAIDEETHRLVRAVAARLAEHPVEGTIEIVPAFASVAVHYDPNRAPNGGPQASPYARFAAAIETALSNLAVETVAAPRTVEIPVCYGGDY
ncbi:MAG TPA: carboxyltransferase domain-containing protein, partial [Gemmatimonadaceae bacterium]|nr:carboxyltransferase domain-containing protein [Gemmatimonadaceae bacterium]